MAELVSPADRWTGRQTRAQYAAIAALRWRMFVNIARRASTPGEIASRVILYTLLAGSAVVLTFGAGGFAWFLIHQGMLNRLVLLFWGIFAMCQMLNLNLGQPGTTFDPTQLIRFPLRLSSFVAVRLFFNLLSPANVMATVMSLAAAAGISLARPRLWPYALLVCAVFAITNVLFSRMVFAWIDRWLSTRRAREIFTAAIFVFSMAFQYVNLNVNAGFGRSRRHHASPVSQQRLNAAATFYHRATPMLNVLPPNLTGHSLEIAANGQTTGFLVDTAGSAAYAALFLVIFGLRMRTEYRGESLSDTASDSSLPSSFPSRSLPPSASAARESAGPPAKQGFLSSSLLALLGKEWTYMRRNTGLLYGLVTPLFLVVLFALRMGRNTTSPWIVPMAIAYALVGIAPMSYNSLGLDGTGAQIYFMAPVPLYRVFLAKNLLHFAIAALEVTVVVAVLSYVAGPPRLLTLGGVLLWACGSLLLSTSLGNRRSVSAPKKINLSRMSGRQASQSSAFLSLGILAACVGYGAGVLFLSAHIAHTWVALPCFAALAVVGVLVYRANLRSLQTFTLAHRDTLFEELGKS